MRISALPISRVPACPRRNGFTLIELLVVLFIIGLVAGAVVISLPGDRSALSEDADRFAARVAAARDEAVLGGRAVAVWITPSGYGFEARRDARWEPLGQRGLDEERWRSGTTARLVAASGGPGAGAPEEAGSAARFYFDPTGLPNAAVTIELTRGAERDWVEVSAVGQINRRR